MQIVRHIHTAGAYSSNFLATESYLASTRIHLIAMPMVIHFHHIKINVVVMSIMQQIAMTTTHNPVQHGYFSMYIQKSFHPIRPNKKIFLKNFISNNHFVYNSKGRCWNVLDMGDRSLYDNVCVCV